MDDIKLDPSEFKDLTVRKIGEGGMNDIPIEVSHVLAQQRLELLAGVSRHVDILGMEIGRNRRASHAVGATDVVYMAMSYENGDGREIVSCKQRGYTLGIRRCVDDNGRTAALGRNNVRIGLEEPQWCRIDEQGHTSFSSQNQAVRVVDTIDRAQSYENELECLPVGELDLITEQRDPVSAGH